jgi:hypothetical protein
MMKRLLMIAASVLAFAGAAHGAEMPKEFYGAWCADVEVSTSIYLPTENCEPGNASVKVSRRGYAIVMNEGGACVALKVTKLGPAYREAAYRIRFRCQGEPGSGQTVEEQWEMKQGVLLILRGR